MGLDRSSGSKNVALEKKSRIITMSNGGMKQNEVPRYYGMSRETVKSII